MSRKGSRKPEKTTPSVQLSADEVAFVRSLVIHEDAEILALAKPAGLSSPTPVSPTSGSWCMSRSLPGPFAS